MIILDKNDVAKVCTETTIIVLNQANAGITMVLLSVEPVENFNF